MRAVPLVALGAVACSYLVPGATFRAKDGASAFTRAVEAVTAHWAGVRFVNPEAQIVTSHWKAFTAPQGVYLARCQVSVVRATDELGADVRIATAFRQCAPDAGSDGADTLADSPLCPVVFELPKEVAEPTQDAVRKVEYDVRR